jgi:hypothetical protein
MKKNANTIWLIPLLAIILVNFQCKKNKNITPEKTELEKLPPITQTGANTFGCLVNGVAWLPNGTKPQNGGPNIVGYVDPTFQGGKFNISAHKYKDILYEGITFGSSNCTSSGSFLFDTLLNSNVNGFQLIKFRNGQSTLNYSSPEIGTYRKGFFNISKYDLSGGIFSGTFECILFNSAKSPDTIKITNGRFDVKL